MLSFYTSHLRKAWGSLFYFFHRQQKVLYLQSFTSALPFFLQVGLYWAMTRWILLDSFSVRAVFHCGALRPHSLFILITINIEMMLNTQSFLIQRLFLALLLTQWLMRHFIYLPHPPILRLICAALQKKKIYFYVVLPVPWCGLKAPLLIYWRPLWLKEIKKNIQIMMTFACAEWAILIAIFFWSGQPSIRHPRCRGTFYGSYNI